MIFGLSVCRSVWSSLCHREDEYGKLHKEGKKYSAIVENRLLKNALCSVNTVANSRIGFYKL